ITVHRQLAELRDEGVRLLGMEASSHALDQHRVAGVRFDTAVFTNLTRDHLDYHGTLEAYAQAKARLFAWRGLRRAIINVDDAFGRELAGRNLDCAKTLCRRTNSFPHGAVPAELYAAHVARGPLGLDVYIDGSFGQAALHSRFIGDFNVDNLLAVLAALLGLGVPLQDAIAALEQCSAPPGRMETLSVPDKPLAIVDYAHTPDALEKALTAARAHCAGQLICVFGCGGERDPGKRPLMGAIAERFADRVIVTDDNPRGEDGDRIVADILCGLAHPQRARVERDRASAIASAIQQASSGDAVLIAGKGHEDYQVVGAQLRRFSDREIALAALRSAS
ncbi:MAG TPA: UDP-N-acetylmuramoyl-L-alanyl-D-glutamate--2,6-diaminopimelate ligase, partial [Steroidobacter sp.]|nr:UDP-N-acetylmuramoyl-L-alanyl-D-glutamate--2,6-diaminopimelate ligase [Steroidobacter sp.]